MSPVASRSPLHLSDVLTRMRAREEQVGELLALGRIAARDAAQLRQQLAEVLVDEGAALVLAVADADGGG